MNATDVLLALAGAYLAGSIPFGLLLGFARGVDLRREGSGNIGATNAKRVLGPALGNLCFALDLLKGAAPVALLGWWLGVLGAADPAAGGALLWISVAAATVLGHVFPVWLRFKGGKGVATGFGALLALWPHVTPAALAALAVWIGALKVTRYVSVASCAAALSLPVTIAALRASGWPAAPDGVGPLAWVARGWPFLALTGALAALVVLRHRGNLARLRAGTEPRVGAGRPRGRTGADGPAGDTPGG